MRTSLIQMVRIILGVSLPVLLFNACGGSDGGDSGGGRQYSLTGSATVPEAAVALYGSLVADKVVTFTFSWSEDDDGLISGTYQDDFFAEEEIALTGKVEANGSRSFEANLATVTGKIASLAFSVPTISSEGSTEGEITLTSFAGKDANAVVVFSKNDVKVKAAVGFELPPTATIGGGDNSSDAKAFFTKVKKTYTWYAENVEADTAAKYEDAMFEHGVTYTLAVSDQPTDKADGGTVEGAWGSVVITGKVGAQDLTKAYNFGGSANDKFEKVDHEQYVSIKRDGYKITLQEKFDPQELFLSLAPDDTAKAFWLFSPEKPEPLTAPLSGLAKYGLEYIVGTHEGTVFSKTNCPMAEGTKFSIEVAADGAVSAGDLGEWTSGDLSSAGSKSTLALWCDGGQTTDPNCNIGKESISISGKSKEVKTGRYRNQATTPGTVCDFNLN